MQKPLIRDASHNYRRARAYIGASTDEGIMKEQMWVVLITVLTIGIILAHLSKSLAKPEEA